MSFDFKENLEKVKDKAKEAATKENLEKVKEKAKEVATKENLEKAKDKAESLFAKGKDKIGNFLDKDDKKDSK